MLQGRPYPLVRAPHESIGAGACVARCA